MNPNTIKEYIRSLEHMTAFFRSILEEENKAIPAPQFENEKLAEFTDLRLLAKSDQWPLAVPEELICGEDEDSKLTRAAGILTDFIKIDLSNKRFLDFGCGEGHIPYVATSLIGVKEGVGYDIESQNWNVFDKPSNLHYYDDFEKLKEHGKFDIILANDVLDHCEAPEDALNQIKIIKDKDGKVYLRCHPWASRHGSHVYKQLNKAYLHLVFNEDELYAMGLKPMYSNKILDPIAYYKKIIEKAGLVILSQEIITHPVELFFTTKTSILRRIKQNWANDIQFHRNVMEIQFVDFVLM